MLADEVQFDRLVGAGREEGGFGEQLDLQRQQVAEDARQRDDHVDARPAELRRAGSVRRRQAGHSCRSAAWRPSAPALARSGRLRSSDCRCPTARSRSTRGSAWPSAMWRCEQPLGLARAVLHREGAGDAERIEAVQVAAGRQDGRRAQQIAARRGAHEAAVERVQDAGESRGPRRAAGRSRARARAAAPAVCRRLPCGAESANDVPACAPAPALRSASSLGACRATLRPRASSRSTRFGRRRRLGRRRAGRAGSACIRVRAPASLEPRDARSALRCPRPVRARPSSSSAACAWISAASSIALDAPPPAQAAPALDRAPSDRPGRGRARPARPAASDS